MSQLTLTITQQTETLTEETVDTSVVALEDVLSLTTSAPPTPQVVVQPAAASLGVALAGTPELVVTPPPAVELTVTAGGLSSGVTPANWSYVHVQDVPADRWMVQHNLGFYPSVTVVDSAGQLAFGELVYHDRTRVEAVFSAAFAGTAYLS